MTDIALDDVCPMSLFERQAIFRENMGGQVKSGMTWDQQRDAVELADLANEQGRDEVLNEIHAMLYALCVDRNLIKDSRS